MSTPEEPAAELHSCAELRDQLKNARYRIGQLAYELAEARNEVGQWKHRAEQCSCGDGNGWKWRTRAAEERAVEAEQRVREHSEEIERLVVRAVEAEQRASTAEANTTDYLDRATCAEEDRNRIEAQARSYKQQAEDAETRAETWEENHQILSEHFQRITTRAETAEAEARSLSESATANLRMAEAYQATARTAANEWVTTALRERARANRAERRAAAWWEAAKTLCRARNDSFGAVASFVSQCRGWQHEAEKSQAALDAANDDIRLLCRELGRARQRPDEPVDTHE